MEAVYRKEGPLTEAEATTTGIVKAIESADNKTLMLIIADNGEADFVEYPRELSSVEQALLKGHRVTHQHYLWSYYSPSDQIFDSRYAVALHVGLLLVPILHSEIKF